MIRNDPVLTHIWVLFVPRIFVKIFHFHHFIMTSKTLYIPPSDDDSSDNEVFQHFWNSTKYKKLQINNTSQYLQIWCIQNWLHFNHQQHKVKYLFSLHSHNCLQLPLLFTFYTTIYYLYSFLQILMQEQC